MRELRSTFPKVHQSLRKWPQKDKNLKNLQGCKLKSTFSKCKFLLKPSWHDCYTWVQVWVSLQHRCPVTKTWLAQIATEILSLLHQKPAGWLAIPGRRFNPWGQKPRERDWWVANLTANREPQSWGVWGKAHLTLRVRHRTCAHSLFSYYIIFLQSSHSQFGVGIFCVQPLTKDHRKKTRL